MKFGFSIHVDQMMIHVNLCDSMTFLLELPAGQNVVAIAVVETVQADNTRAEI